MTNSGFWLLSAHCIGFTAHNFTDFLQIQSSRKSYFHTHSHSFFGKIHCSHPDKVHNCLVNILVHLAATVSHLFLVETKNRA